MNNYEPVYLLLGVISYFLISEIIVSKIQVKKMIY